MTIGVRVVKKSDLPVGEVLRALAQKGKGYREDLDVVSSADLEAHDVNVGVHDCRHVWRAAGDGGVGHSKGCCIRIDFVM